MMALAVQVGRRRRRSTVSPAGRPTASCASFQDGRPLPLRTRRSSDLFCAPDQAAINDAGARPGPGSRQQLSRGLDISGAKKVARSLAACAPRAYDGRAGASQPRSGPQSRRPARRACRCRAAAPSPWACAREWPRTADCWGRGPARARHRPRTYRPCARFALRVRKRKPKWTCPGCGTSSIHPSARRRLRTVRVLRRFSACPRAPRHGSSAAGTVPEPAYVWSLLHALSLPPAQCEFGAW